MDLIIISDGRTDETSLRIKKVEIMGNEQLQLVLKYIVYQENKIFNLFFFFFFFQSELYSSNYQDLH